MGDATFSHRYMEFNLEYPDKCSKHSCYRAIRAKPRVQCANCWKIFFFVRKWGKKVKGQWLIPAR